MTPTYEQREERYQSAPSHIQELYAGEDVGEFLRATFEHYQLREELYYDYTQAFGDVVLEFEEQARLPQLLTERMGLPIDLGTVLAHDLLEYINTHIASTPGTTSAPASATPRVAPVVAPLYVQAAYPSPTQLEQKYAPQGGAPAWSERTLGNSSEQAPTPSGAVPTRTIDTPAEAPNTKPLTDIPRYTAHDPYREPPAA